MRTTHNRPYGGPEEFERRRPHRALGFQNSVTASDLRFSVPQAEYGRTSTSTVLTVEGFNYVVEGFNYVVDAGRSSVTQYLNAHAS